MTSFLCPHCGNTVGLSDGAVGRQATCPDCGRPAERFDFLAPPQGPGEIGRLASYRILKQLGAGGMGVVFLAEDVRLGRRVALKVMRPNLAADAIARQRFLREARTCAAVKHDHVVEVYEVGEDRGVPFMAMQHLDGESLDACLMREGPLSTAEVLRIGQETADALAAAHKLGLIHRDIKPGNIWLKGERRSVKILDFGLARGMESDTQLTLSGCIVGSPAYMAPEQAAKGRIDCRCDLFSLGCVLYEAAVGERPFQGEGLMGMLAALVAEDPTPPCEANRAVPRELSDLILHLLAKNPGNRPASARETAAALKVIAADATKTRPPSRATIRLPAQATRKAPPPPATVRRATHRGPWAWLIAGAAVLVVGMSAALALHIWLGRAPAGVQGSSPPDSNEEEPFQPPPITQPLDPTRAVNLMDRIDPQRDSVRGKWEKKGGVLLAEGGANEAALVIPYSPPTEYRLEMVLERTGEAGLPFHVGLYLGGRPAILTMDMRGDRKGLVDSFLEQARWKHPSQPLFHPNNAAHVTLEVQPERLDFLCDGNHVLTWKGNGERFTNPWPVGDKFQKLMADKSALFLQADGPFSIHAMTLTPRPLRDRGWSDPGRRFA